MLSAASSPNRLVLQKLVEGADDDLVAFARRGFEPLTLMLGFEVAQSTVSKYMVQGGSPSQGWKTFFRNHAQAIAAVDLFVVPTLTFERLFAFLVLSHNRRQLLWFEVTRHPTAEWLAGQITEAFPWASAPAYLVRDNDRAYGHAFSSRVRAMGIRDRPISPGSPWQNAYVERLIGTVRRECLDRLVVFGEAHLRQILSSYAAYYNEVRTHLSLGKDAPRTRPIERFGDIIAQPILGGYCWTRAASGHTTAPPQVEHATFLPVADDGLRARVCGTLSLPWAGRPVPL